MKKIYTILASLLLLNLAFAGDGDITIVQAHQDVNMTWYGGYDEMVSFPDSEVTYQKILMHYTLGCSSNQCSDWDYTTRILARHNTGMLDSTVASLDTISLSPLVVDTTWNVFDVLEPFELGRVITPYGGYMAQGSNGYNNDWKHTYTFDVTDFAPILKGDVSIRAFYDGWSDGFSVNLTFEFVEGTPAREVLGLWNYRKGSFTYNNASNVESTHLPSKAYDFPEGAANCKMRVTVSGHGFDNNLNCAEFCQRNYYLKVNGNQVGSNLIWRDDCGFNPIYPQGGTWVFSRAGWCPGDIATIHEHELSSAVNYNNTTNFDIDLDGIAWSGTQAPSYYFDAVLVSYASPTYTTEAALTDIINPSDKDAYGRINPSCANPKIKVKNEGAGVIISMKIEYGVYGAPSCEYTWSGALLSFKSQEIELPTPSFDTYNPDNPEFFARIVSVNGVEDDYSLNNYMKTSFDVPPVYNTSKLQLVFQTNNRPNENSYQVLDMQGNVLYERSAGSLSGSTIYSDDFNLAPGCYTLRFKDTGIGGDGDGLSWWYSSNYLGATSGYIFLKDGNSGQTFINFNPDFGNELYHQFVIGESLTDITGECTTSSVTNLLPSNSLKISPNPSKGVFELAFDMDENLAKDISVFNLLGEQVYAASTFEKNHSLSLSNMPTGVYFVQIRTKNGSLTKEIVIQR